MNNELFSHELTVSELTSLIKSTLEQGFYGLKVTGEISNFRPSSTGHWFFSLKDQDAYISAVMFRGKLWRVPFTPMDGDKVTVTGSIDVYEKRGTYQIVCDTMEKAGSGDILAMLEERKKKYDAMGWFAPELKKPLPTYPKRVGVITSPTGAALQDILQILGRRAPFLDVLIYPAVVQGDEAAASIAERIEEANMMGLCDVLIVGRGGGSLEDLLPFSEECVITAIHESKIPVVSAVGHEIDWAISDFVADMRAPTPSAGAELVSQGYMKLRSDIIDATSSLCSFMEQKIHIAEVGLAYYNTERLSSTLQKKTEDMEYRLANATEGLERGWWIVQTGSEHSLLLAKERLQSVKPTIQLEKQEMALETKRQLLMASWQATMQHLQTTLSGTTSQLQALDPLAILKRGFSVVMGADGKVITHAKDLKPKMEVALRFSDGKRQAIVKE
jgi:exodeoxyribonuclease VII large subunit